jgi:NADH:ubiquinone oxidoreductase subunit 4 (subunit M)
LAGGFYSNTITAFFISFGMILGAAYSLWLANRLLFGKLTNNYIQKYKDVSKRELAIMLPLIFNVVLLGIIPELVFETFHMSSVNLLTAL